MRKKLYCFVDETGQDTQGSLFIVVAVIVSNEYEGLRLYLEKIEGQTGLGKRKWVRTKTAVVANQTYFKAIDEIYFKKKLYYSVFKDTGTGTYRQLLVLAVAEAINSYRAYYKVDDNYKVSVIIDGLKGSESLKVTRQLKPLGIKYKKVRGARDESEPFIRLADRVAGLIRDADNNQSFLVIRQYLDKHGVIKRLK